MRRIISSAIGSRVIKIVDSGITITNSHNGSTRKFQSNGLVFVRPGIIFTESGMVEGPGSKNKNIEARQGKQEATRYSACIEKKEEDIQEVDA